jgi:hypothetical protein
VRELYWNGWNGTDLTADTNGPSATQGELTSFWDGQAEHVLYMSYPDAHVRELYYANGNWTGNDLTADTNGPPAALASCNPLYHCINSFFDGSVEHVFYASGDGHVREMYYVNGAWHSSGRTKLVDPDVTSAFELGSGNGFASQQRILDQLGIGLGVDHGLQEFSFEPIGQMLQHLFQQTMRMLPVCRQNSWGNFQSSI